VSTSKPKIPPAALLGIFVALVLDTVIQITWKLAASAVPPSDSYVSLAATVLASPYFYTAMALFALQLFNWVKVLSHIDLSFAQPMTALSYVSVLTYSSLYLHERVSLTHSIGIFFILGGVLLISKTEHKTAL
jgi:hypothetical protein